MAILRCLHLSHSLRRLFMLTLILLLCLQGQVHSSQAVPGPVVKKIFIPLVVKIDQPNRPPTTPSSPAPANGAANQAINLTLQWSGGDPDGDPVTYTVYLDTQNPPVTVAAANLVNAKHTAASLNPSTRYYWKVEAKDSPGRSTAGPVWSFTTQNSQPPAAAGSRLSTFGAVYCAVTSAGAVQCWGNPNAGWDGQIFADESNVPVTIAGLSGVKSVSLGDGFACVLTSAGGVKCWGNNGSGQLGNGTQTPSSAPVNVTGLTSGVKQIAVGGLFACALLNTGAVKCWGNNKTGQLGINSLTNQSTPAQVIGLTSGVSVISAGERHVCAVKSGALSCWGSSEDFQVGSSRIDILEFWKPEPVDNMSSGVSTVWAAKRHTCALKNGALLCWGLNAGGELGTGDALPGVLPAEVVGMQSGVKFVSPGQHTCVILNGGAAKCMGWNTYGELGGGVQSEYSFAPVTVKGISGAVEIASGQNSTCALLTTGKLLCWGSNIYSQLGAGLTSDLSLVPVPVTGW